MKRHGWMMAAVWGLLVGVCCATTQADWSDFFRRSYVDARRMNSWPDPFRHMDREATLAPFERFKDAGWRLENTLVDALFTDDHELTYPGKLKVRHILTQVPAHRRSVYVLQGQTRDMTEKRVDAVQRAIAEIMPQGNLPPVLVTEINPRGGAGDYLYLVNNKYRQSIPSPVLPTAQGAGGTEGM
jgi:hypothetical protein